MARTVKLGPLACKSRIIFVGLVTFIYVDIHETPLYYIFLPIIHVLIYQRLLVQSFRAKVRVSERWQECRGGTDNKWREGPEVAKVQGLRRWEKVTGEDG